MFISQWLIEMYRQETSSSANDRVGQDLCFFTDSNFIDLDNIFATQPGLAIPVDM